MASSLNTQYQHRIAEGHGHDQLESEMLPEGSLSKSRNGIPHHTCIIIRGEGRGRQYKVHAKTHGSTIVLARWRPRPSPTAYERLRSVEARKST
eukprot:scaffold258420_cov33-Tisochrysis_lutea.AAC.2